MATRMFRVEVEGPKAGPPLWWNVSVALGDESLETVGTLHPWPGVEGDGPPFRFTAQPIGADGPVGWKALGIGPYTSMEHFLGAIERHLVP